MASGLTEAVMKVVIGASPATAPAATGGGTVGNRLVAVVQRWIGGRGIGAAPVAAGAAWEPGSGSAPAPERGGAPLHARDARLAAAARRVVGQLVLAGEGMAAAVAGEDEALGQG